MAFDVLIFMLRHGSGAFRAWRDYGLHRDKICDSGDVPASEPDGRDFRTGGSTVLEFSVNEHGTLIAYHDWDAPAILRWKRACLSAHRDTRIRLSFDQSGRVDSGRDG